MTESLGLGALSDSDDSILGMDDKDNGERESSKGLSKLSFLSSQGTHFLDKVGKNRV